MQGFVHLVLLTFLFIASVTGQDFTTASPSTPEAGASTSANAGASNIINSVEYTTNGNKIPGTFIMKHPYEIKLEDKDSEEYKGLYETINTFFKGKFKEKYEDTDITQISPWLSEPPIQAGEEKIYVTVVHIFKEGIQIGKDEIIKTINNEFGDSGIKEYDCTIFSATFRMIYTYNSDLENKESQGFIDLYKEINPKFQKAFGNDYQNTIITQVSPWYQTIPNPRNEKIYVTVVHIFKKEYEVNEDKIFDAVENIPDKPMEGYNYKTFSGTFRMEYTYESKLENKDSNLRIELHEKINNFFKTILENGYEDTIITQVRPSYSSTSGLPNRETIYVAVVHLFPKGTKIENDQIINIINEKREEADILEYNCRTFPGIFRMKYTYTSKLEDKESDAYKALHEEINNFFKGIFKDDYEDTIITLVSPLYSTTPNPPNENKIYVTVVHSFKEGTQIENQQVIDNIKKNLATSNILEYDCRLLPGTFRMQHSYTPDLGHKESVNYKALLVTISVFFREALGQDYEDTIITQVSPSYKAHSDLPDGLRSYVTVLHILNKANTPEEKLIEDIEKKIFESKSYWDYNCKEFPGTFRMIYTYKTGLENKESADYKDLNSNIFNYFQELFGQNYENTIITQVSLSYSTTPVVPEKGKIYVTIVHIFMEKTKLTEAAVIKKINLKFNTDTSKLYWDYNCKEFPGTFRMKHTYTTDLEDKESADYKNLNLNINKFFQKLDVPNYAETIITQVSPSYSSKPDISAAQNIYVTIVHIFKKDTALTEETLIEKINIKFDSSDSYWDYNCKELPGIFTMKHTYTTGLEDKESADYKTLYSTINEFFQGVFPTHYEDTVITQVSPLYSETSDSTSEKIYVTVVHIFKKGTQDTAQEVIEKINSEFEISKKFLEYDCKTFPGTFRMKYSYKTELEDKESKDYRDLFLVINKFFQEVDVLNYEDTVITHVRKSYSNKAGVSEEGKIYVTITHILKKGSALTEKALVEKINKKFAGDDSYWDYNCKEFPGTFRMKHPYTPDLGDKESANYKSLHSTINTFFQELFTDYDYEDTAITQVRQSYSQTPILTEEEIYVTIVHVFKKDTVLREDKVTTQINKAFESSKSYSDYNCKEFLGTFRMKYIYTRKLEEKESEEYKTLHSTINEFFAGVFQPDYQRTIVDRVRPSNSSTYVLHNEEKIYVTVVQLLNKDTTLTEEKVTAKVNTAFLGDDRFSDYNSQLRPCEKNGCIGGSTCVNLNDTSFCQCSDGQYYKDDQCKEGKVFPGKIIIRISYTPELKDKESLAYQKLHWNMTNFFAKVFLIDYGQTIIQKVSQTSSARHGQRAAENVNITLVNILSKDTKRTEDQVYREILREIVSFQEFVNYTNKLRPCEYGTCSVDSLCVELYNTSFCMCSEGSYYKEGQCAKGILFPGKLTMKISDISKLEDKESSAYQELHFKVSQFFAEIFPNDYGQTIIHSISPSTSARYSMKAAGNAEVTVTNIFNKDTRLTEKDVVKMIQKATDFSEEFVNFGSQDMCEYYGCEPNDNNCADSFTCSCKPGMYRPNPQSPHCAPDPCPKTCASKSNMHCQWNETIKRADCVCLPDYKKDGNDICQKCAFGYSGVDCQNQDQLIFTIIGSIGGICILILVIALIFMGVRSKNKKQNDQQALVENDFQNLKMQQTEFSRPGAGGNLFPKIHTTPSSPWQNPYNSSSRRNMPRPDY